MHCKRSPSGLHRSLVCHASLKYGDSPTTEAAERGTRIHAFCDRVLRDPSFLGLVGLERLAEMHGVEVDDAQIALDTYVTYVQTVLPLWAETVKTEQVVGAMFGGGLMFGTADFVAYTQGVMLEIVDLKCGKGMFVEVADNPQLLAYACATLGTFKLEVEEIKVTIVQPYWTRTAAPIVRSASISTSKLKDWHAETSEIIATADMETHVPGDHCTFCNGLRTHQCPAQKHLGQAVMSYDFDNVDWESILTFLDNKSLITKSLTEAGTLAKAYLNAGGTLGNYTMVPKYSDRSWSVNDRTVVRRLGKAGLKKDDIWVKTLISPAQAEKKGMPKAAVKDITGNVCTGEKMIKLKTKPEPKLDAGLEALMGVTTDG